MDDRRKRDLAAGWYRDSWNEWHGPTQDLGNSGPRDPSGRPLPPHLRPGVAPDTSPTPSEAPEAVPVAASASETEIDDDTALKLLVVWLRRLASRL